MNKLPKEFKEKFLAELRSGKHKQGKSVMYNPADDSLCCLAVAGLVCGLTKDEMAGVDILTAENDYDDPSGRKNPSSKKAIHQLGYPLVLTASYDTKGCDLASMNDSGKSFSEIADWIEENL